ncbi:uroporphyrinogen-III C-methyltransferase [Rhodanobacter sp. 115]|uniref:uroporphyrinogen-III C-methyltransferase n=2 Tax=Rhodanobacter sp. FW021-MT20 TaxID=1162282 RepID=UPI0034E56287
MSQDDLTRDPAAPTGAPSDSRRAKVAAAPPRRSGGGTLALALLLALLAIAGTGYVGWQQWRQMQHRGASERAATDMQQRVSVLEHTLAGVSSNGSSLQQRLNDAEQVNNALREQLLGQNDRLRALESAVGKLSEKTLSGHDAMLLDNTESLLRMGQQRYELFHDARGAAAAYALAEQTLAAVDDQAFAGLRQSIEAERNALLQSAPASRDAMLASVAQLRADAVKLPLKPLDSDATPDQGAWGRVSRALSSVISIHRDNGAPLAVADAGLVRELLGLDLAQAQAALLARDAAAADAALKRADASLAASFDAQADEVKQARAQIATLLQQIKPSAPVQLGAALSELRNLRSVHALAGSNTSPSTAAPAPASSSHGAQP